MSILTSFKMWIYSLLYFFQFPALARFHAIEGYCIQKCGQYFKECGTSSGPEPIPFFSSNFLMWYELSGLAQSSFSFLLFYSQKFLCTGTLIVHCETIISMFITVQRWNGRVVKVSLKQRYIGSNDHLAIISLHKRLALIWLFVLTLMQWFHFKDHSIWMADGWWLHGSFHSCRLNSSMVVYST